MGLKRFVRKITRPVAKVLDKVVPNEIKPALPYLAAVAPFMLPAGGIGSLSAIGINNPAIQRAVAAGAINLGSQLAQEGSDGDFDPFTLALSAGTGYLSTPGATDKLVTNADRLKVLEASEGAYQPQGILQQAKDFGIKGLKGANKLLSEPVRSGGPGLFSKAGIKAASVPITGQLTKDAMDFAKQAQLDYEAELAEYNRFVEDQNLARVANDEDRARAIYNSMVNAGAFTLDTIKDTLDELDLPSGFFAYGGRVKLASGGTPVYLEDSLFKDKDYLSMMKNTEKLEGIMDLILKEKRRPSDEEFKKGTELYEILEKQSADLSDKFDPGDKYTDAKDIDPKDRRIMELLVMEKMLGDTDKRISDKDTLIGEMIRDMDSGAGGYKEGGRIGAKDGYRGKSRMKDFKPVEIHRII
jgi:hypothetical protein